MKKILTKFPAAALSMAAMMIVAGCSGGDKSTQPADGGAANGDDDVPMVEVSRVGVRPVEQTGEYTATVEAFKTNNISSSTPNRIKQILVDVGSRVKAGQRLVVLDNVNIDQMKVRLDNTRRDYGRALKLLEIGAGTQQHVDNLKTELDAAERNYANMLENTVLTAPISGVVTARNYDPGDMTGNLPVLTVEQIHPVKVVVNVSETDYARVSRNMPVRITLDTYPDRTFNGRVHLVHPSVDPQSRTFAVEMTIDNAGEEVLPGMFARVENSYGTAEHVVVPDRAVVKMPGSGNKYVYVYRNGTVSYNRVELGRRLGSDYEIISGVADGDSVVVTGQSRLSDGVRVKLSTPKTATSR